MSKWIFIFAVFSLFPKAFGQGYVVFDNRVPELNLDAGVYNGIEGVAWNRPETVVQLYAAPESDLGNHVPVGLPVPLPFDGDDAGYWGSDMPTAVDFANPGETVYLEVRGWELALGSTFEEAIANSSVYGFFGSSAGVPLTLGTLEEPAYLINNPPRPDLTSFGLFPNVPIPEPTTIVLFSCGVLLGAGKVGRPIKIG